MGREIVYCESCGDRIVASDFEKGHAITAGSKNYCGKCAPNIPKAQAAVPPVQETTRKESLPASPSKGASTRRTSRGQPQGRTRRVPIQKDSERKSKRRSHAALLIGLIVGGLILLLLVILVLATGQPPRE